MEKKLRMILVLLNGIEIKGEKNLNDMLAAIQMTRDLLKENSNGMDSN